jgi:transposase-like protein
MWKPTLRQQEMIADMANGGMSSERIAAAVGISHGVYTSWVSRLMAARALDPEAVDDLLYPPKPVPVQPPPAQRDPRIVAERIFEAAE